MNPLDEGSTYFMVFPFFNPQHVKPSGWVYKILEVEIVKDPGIEYFCEVVAPKGKTNDSSLHRLCDPKLLFKTEDELRLAYALKGQVVV